MDFNRFDVLTFDCYGTLIDWENGILDAMRPVLQKHGVSLSDEDILAHYACLEPVIQQTDFLPYREVLCRVVRGFGDALGFTPDDTDCDSLPQSLAHWQPFPDTVEALKVLASRYRLGVISNVDDDLFAHSVRLLEVPFAWVVTAQQVGSYKPSQGNFHAAFEAIGLPRERILHVAQSLHHDIAPARDLGLTTVWVNRQSGRPGSGATIAADVRPHLEVPDLRTLVALVTDSLPVA